MSIATSTYQDAPGHGSAGRRPKPDPGTSAIGSRSGRGARHDDEAPGAPGSIPVDWQALARTHVHPLRISIIELLGIDGGRLMSPNELSFELQVPLSNTNYHVGALEKAEMIVLMDERAVRGVTEHFYSLPSAPLKSWFPDPPATDP